jgi:hypothetical protein
MGGGDSRYTDATLNEAYRLYMAVMTNNWKFEQHISLAGDCINGSRKIKVNRNKNVRIGTHKGELIQVRISNSSSDHRMNTIVPIVFRVWLTSMYKSYSCMQPVNHESEQSRTYLLNKSMLKNTYSPLSKFCSAALIIILRTVAGDAHRITTARIEQQQQQQYMSSLRNERLAYQAKKKLNTPGA